MGELALTTALYLRLSVDDENNDESDSIANQRDLLNAYVSAHPTEFSGEVLTFADDGWSGTNFERPQVKELLDLARSGGVQCIIVKDLSRWGRNYPEVSMYLDRIFPFLGVRFISLGEGYDSSAHKGQTVPLNIAFGTIMHDIYCKDLSGKVRQSYVSRTKKGEFLCGCPPFGFVKSSSEKNRLEVDSEAADIVRRIFSMACGGNTTTEIAVLLNNDGVDTPLMYRKRKGRTLPGAHSAAIGRVFWTSESVRKILIDERYTGVMISGKKRVSYPGSRRRDYLPEREWIRIPDTHEAIVSKDEFKRVNANIRRWKVTSNVKNRSLFSGKIKCGGCKRSMAYAATKDPYYRCNISKLYGGTGCFDGRIKLAMLSEIVLTTVKIEALKVFNTFRRQNQSADEMKDRGVNGELKRMAARIAFLKRRGIELFEDLADGKIEEYKYLSAIDANGIELRETQTRINEVRSLTSAKSNKPDSKPMDDSFMQRIVNNGTVTDELLSLIECIYVFNNDRIDIRFSFKDGNSAGCKNSVKS